MLERLKYLGLAFGVLALDIFASSFVFRSTDSLLVLLFIQGILLTALGLIVWIGWKSRLLTFSLKAVKKYLPWIFLGYTGILMTNFLGAWILELEGFTNTVNQEIINDSLAHRPASLMFLTIVCLAPLAEEIICRGLIPRLVFKGYERWGYLLGGLLFAVLHGPTNLGSWVIYGGMSAIVTYLAYRSKSLEVSIALHLLNNGIAFLLLLILGTG